MDHLYNINNAETIKDINKKLRKNILKIDLFIKTLFFSASKKRYDKKQWWLNN